MARMLIIDTSCKYMVVGIASNEKIIYSTQIECFQRQSEIAMDEVYKALEITKTDPKKIDKVIVTVGPGSYTGIRIALTIAKVYCSTLKIPLVGVSTLRAMAGCRGKKIALMDARSNRAYIGIYDGGDKVVEDTVLPLEEIKALLESYKGYKLVGDTHLLGIDSNEIDFVKNLYEIGKNEDGVVDCGNVNPIYLKDR